MTASWLVEEQLQLEFLPLLLEFLNFSLSSISTTVAPRTLSPHSQDSTSQVRPRTEVSIDLLSTPAIPPLREPSREQVDWRLAIHLPRTAREASPRTHHRRSRVALDPYSGKRRHPSSQVVSPGIFLPRPACTTRSGYSLPPAACTSVLICPRSTLQVLFLKSPFLRGASSFPLSFRCGLHFTASPPAQWQGARGCAFRACKRRLDQDLPSLPVNPYAPPETLSFPHCHLSPSSSLASPPPTRSIPYPPHSVDVAVLLHLATPHPSRHLPLFTLSLSSTSLEAAFPSKSASPPDTHSNTLSLLHTPTHHLAIMHSRLVSLFVLLAAAVLVASSPTASSIEPRDSPEPAFQLDLSKRFSSTVALLKSRRGPTKTSKVGITKKRSLSDELLSMLKCTSALLHALSLPH